MLVLGPNVHARAGVHLLPATVVLEMLVTFRNIVLTISEKVKPALETKSSHNLKSKCELGPCASHAVLTDCANVFQAVTGPLKSV